MSSQFVLRPDIAPQSRRAGVPLAFMHIPKAAGTSLMRAIDEISPAGHHVRGFDRSLFGDFSAFDDIPALMRRVIHLNDTDFAPEAMTICGHFAFTTLAGRYPQADLVTFLREPVARLLSHWTYWRGLRWRHLRHWGPGWSGRLKLARLPLDEFLSRPEIACQTDNVVTRMLAWPHECLPAHGFIDPADDAQLLQIAISRLRRFSHADIVERGPDMLDDFAAWYGAPLQHFNLNETARLPRRLRTGYPAALTPRNLALLHDRSRLDIKLWTQVAAWRLKEPAIHLLQEHAKLRAAARAALLLG